MRRVLAVVAVVFAVALLPSTAWAEPSPIPTTTVTETATPTPAPTVTETATATATATPSPAVVDNARAMEQTLTAPQLVYVVIGGVLIALGAFAVVVLL